MSHANPEAQFPMGTREEKGQKAKKEKRDGVAKEVKLPNATLSSSEGWQSFQNRLDLGAVPKINEWREMGSDTISGGAAGEVTAM